MMIDLPDVAAVEALGKRIAAVLQAGDVVALTGALGAGKTTLARAIIAGLGHRGEVPSPSFTLIETYDLLDPPLIHADFYRIENQSEIKELGLDDYREGAALIAEWPERVGGFAHEPACLSVRIEMISGKNKDGARRAIVEAGADWQSRWP